MVGRKHITPKRQQKPRLVITENFLKELETVIMYGYTVFGDNTAKKFLNGILGRIFALPSMPHANPKSRLLKVRKERFTGTSFMKNIMWFILSQKLQFV
jgi:hypothetical protein